MEKEKLDVDGGMKVEYDRTLMLYGQAPGAVFVSLAAAAGLLFIGMDASAPAMQWAWGAVLAILMVLRVALVLSCRRSVMTPQSAPMWNTLYVSLVVASGIHFALWVGFFFAELPVLHRLVSALIFGAMAGGSMAVLSVRRWLATTYGTLILLPPSMLLLLVGDQLETAAGILGLIYLLTMYFSVAATGKNVVAALAYSHLNEGLLTEAREQRVAIANVNLQLESAQLELEQINRDLELRITERTAELERIATHDTLTGLSNRRRLAELTGIVIEADSEPLAVYLLDLDGFKDINDSMGHAVGDLVLTEVARRLKLMTTDSFSYALSRWGGDEFVILRRRSGRKEDVIEYAHSLLAALCEPIDRHAFSLGVDACVGIALWPEDGKTLGELIDRADMAVYSAKAVGHGQVGLFTTEMSSNARRSLKLKHALSQALATNDPRLQLAYQPIFDAVSGRIVAFEALARWEHPDFGAISPVEFIALAETSGDIISLGEWVLQKACVFAASLWSDSKPSINVNISAKQLKHPDFWSSVKSALRRSGLEPERLTLELTESVFALDSDRALEVLKNIERLGVQLAIDDFGTGYSSLSYLQRLHASTLKIDRSFVSTLDSGGRPIIEASLSLAHAFGMRVVAEGIENEFQVEVLRRLGVDCFQGYLLGVPQSEANARALVDPIHLDPSGISTSDYVLSATSKRFSNRDVSRASLFANVESRPSGQPLELGQVVDMKQAAMAGGRD